MKKWMLRIMLLLFWPVGFLISWITSFRPEPIEVLYSRWFSKTLAGYLSRVTGIFPFSVAELTVWLFLLCTLILLLKSVIISFRKRKGGKRGLFGFLFQLLIFLGIIYFSFIVIWGLNYNRLPFAETAGFHVKGFSEKQLVQLCEKLIQKANSLRAGLPEDERGVMKAEGGFAEIRKTAPLAYIKGASIYPELGGNFGAPKPVFFSRLMSYTGISGIYFPFTGEANVNIDIPDPVLPATTCHEMAHQRGFAREDEANYLAWVTCSSSDNAAFQYSGTILALMYASNALFDNNPPKAYELNKKYGAGLRRDLQAISQYWKQYEGRVEEFTSDVNDTYLKSNRQEEGVASYGRMVDLLLAEQNADPGKKFLL
ncbi:MAG: DUF3810 domain-containing protein [Peptococcaceae bacterium]|nr:DUF3810 domain-containing protein [Peptococcaceae bacterium]